MSADQSSDSIWFIAYFYLLVKHPSDHRHEQVTNGVLLVISNRLPVVFFLSFRRRIAAVTSLHWKRLIQCFVDGLFQWLSSGPSVDVRTGVAAEFVQSWLLYAQRDRTDYSVGTVSPWTATSTFTQPLSPKSLFSHCSFSVLYVHTERPYGQLETGRSPGRPPRLSHSP